MIKSSIMCFPIRTKFSLTSLSLLPFFLFFLFDNYISKLGVRPLDFIGLALLVLLAVLQWHHSGMKLKISSSTLLIVGIGFLYLLGSLTLHPEQFKPHIGIMLGLLVFTYYRSLSSIGDVYAKGLSRILQVSISALGVQLLYYLVTGVVLKLLLVAPGDVRVWYGGTILRLTGFFMEPNSYCLATAMLVLLRRHIMNRSFDRLSYIAIGSMFVTMSLWGVIIGLLLIAYELLSRGLRGVLMSIFILLPSISMLAFITFVTLGAENPFKVTVVNRIEKIITSTTGHSDSDMETSFAARYLVLEKMIDLDNLDYTLLFGHGVSTDAFQGYGGANGLSFMIYSIGLIGMLLLAFSIIISARDGTGKLFMILITLSSYPLVTYFFWWAWLGLLFAAPERSRIIWSDMQICRNFSPTKFKILHNIGQMVRESQKARLTGKVTA